MKIGLCTETFQDKFGYEEGFARLREIGYEGSDFSFCGPFNKPRPIFSQPRAEWVAHYRDAKRALDNAGMAATQCHATYGTNYDGNRRLSDDCLDQFKKEIEAAAIVGSPYIVIHPINLAVLERDKQLDFEVNMEAFGKFEPILKEFNVKLGVENMFSWDGVRNRLCPTGCSSPDDMIQYIDSMHSDTFVACLDTGHMQINGFNPANAVRKLGSRLKLLHVHDNFAIKDDHSAPTQGVTDWHDFAAALREVNYDGCFSLEINFSRIIQVSLDLVWDYARFAYNVARKILA